MAEKVCRWGFMSTAGIGKKNWRAVRRSGNGTIVAVASRSLDSANAFIDECQKYEPFSPTPVALDSYEKLLADKNVDAVYIPLPTGMRKEWILKAIAAGKHVMAEKPAGLHASDLEEILAKAEEKHVQYMDGVMFMHSERLPKLREVLDDGVSVGAIRRIATQFSFYGDEIFRTSNIRSISQSEPHGCLGDLGWYCIRMILWTLNWQMPKSVIGRTLTPFRGHGSQEEVPGEFSADLFFDDGVSASFYCSFMANHQQWFHVTGEKGYVLLNDFVLPYCGPEVAFDVVQNEFVADGCEFHMENHQTRHAVHEYASGRATAQEVSLFRNFGHFVGNGKLDNRWGQYTLKTQRVMDALWESSKRNAQQVAIA